MTADDVRDLIRKHAQGNQSAWAISNGVSPQYVSDILTGRREPGQAILKALKLERVMIYRKVAA